MCGYDFAHLFIEEHCELILSDWILLDSCSTNNVFKNKDLLKDLDKCPQGDELILHTNGGTMLYQYITDMKCLPLQAFHNPDSLANILSLKHVMGIPGCKVSMETHPKSAFLVTLYGRTIRFNNGREGLFHCKALELQSARFTNPKTESFMKVPRNQGAIFITSVDDEYTQKEKKLANNARRLQETLLWPSKQAVISYLRSGHIKNCGLRLADFERANKIFRHPKSILTRKMIAPSQKSSNQTQLSLGLQTQPNIKLCIDVFFINSLAFLHTKSEPLNYITI